MLMIGGAAVVGLVLLSKNNNPVNGINGIAKKVFRIRKLI
jgi:hypothetical protein